MLYALVLMSYLLYLTAWNFIVDSMSIVNGIYVVLRASYCATECNQESSACWSLFGLLQLACLLLTEARVASIMGLAGV